MEFRKGNTRWHVGIHFLRPVLDLAGGVLLLPKMGLAEAVDNVSMACYLGIWGLFTLYMFVGTLKKHRALQVVFGSLAALFFLLAIGDYRG